MGRFEERETVFKAGDRAEVVSSAAIMFVPKGDLEDEIKDGAKIDVFLDGDLLFTFEEDEIGSEELLESYDPCFPFLKAYDGSYCYADYLDSIAEELAKWLEDDIPLITKFSGRGKGSSYCPDWKQLEEVTGEGSWEKVLNRYAQAVVDSTSLNPPDICLSATYLNSDKLPDIAKISERVQRVLNPKTRFYNTLQDLIDYEIVPELDDPSEYYMDDITDYAVAHVDRGYCIIVDEDDLWDIVQAARL